MSHSTVKSRPPITNIGPTQILSYRLPASGKVSILHRISGILLFLALPLVIVPLFAASVDSPATFERIASLTNHPIPKVIFLVLIWGYFHHFFAGIRYLLLDLHIGIDKASAQKTASLVLGATVALTLVCALKLFGVW